MTAGAVPYAVVAVAALLAGVGLLWARGYSAGAVLVSQTRWAGSMLVVLACALVLLLAAPANSGTPPPDLGGHPSTPSKPPRGPGPP